MLTFAYNIITNAENNKILLIKDRSKWSVISAIIKRKSSKDTILSKTNKILNTDLKQCVFRTKLLNCKNKNVIYTYISVLSDDYPLPDEYIKWFDLNELPTPIHYPMRISLLNICLSQNVPSGWYLGN